MATSTSRPASDDLRFKPRNVALLAAGFIVIAVGYWWLKAGGTTGAAALLVLGYLVLLPLGIAL
jgi:hypothetical protein